MEGVEELDSGGGGGLGVSLDHIPAADDVSGVAFATTHSLIVIATP